MSNTEDYQDIESISELKEKTKQQSDAQITFDNQGNMVVNNRAHNRNFKQLWRAAIEHKIGVMGEFSLRWFTKKKRKNIKGKRKQERQNKKKARQYNG